jgi:TatD DNase family protein
MLIDAHCHLDMLAKEGVSVAEAIQHAKERGVNRVVVNGVNPAHNREILNLKQTYKEVRAALGMYPIDALSMDEDEILGEIAFITSHAGMVDAIGEVGLDLKEGDTTSDSFEKQKWVLTQFVMLAQRIDKPVIVHSRKAEREVIELLTHLGAKKVVMHCFSGRMNLVDEIVQRGWLLSIPANVKYSQQFQDVVRRVPLHNLLCETDSPYLNPHKTWPNEPANVSVSYDMIAEIKGLPVKDVATAIEQNYLRIFGN